MLNPEKTDNNVTELPLATHAGKLLDFRTHPDNYCHWKLETSGPIANLVMDVSEDGGAFPGYELKLNSYDIGVDIELYDAIQRLRFEHPEVKTVVVGSNKPTMFCAGANIRMLAGASHGHKVNFCKFTNETRNAIEDAGEFSGQRYLCALNGTAAGGGYELALAMDYLILIDDGNAAVSLPEIPLLAVLPGTGGLTRIVDKRKVRRDLADVFCTVEEGVKGRRALDWRLVDEIVPSSQFDQRVAERAREMCGMSDRPDMATGVQLTPLCRTIRADGVGYDWLNLSIDRNSRNVTLQIRGPDSEAPGGMADVTAMGDRFWPLALARELDDALLHLRFSEPDIGTMIIKSSGSPGFVKGHDEFLQRHNDDWLIREIILYWKRTLKRLDLTSRTSFAFIEPGSCFVGLLAELLFAVDRSYMLEGQFEDDDTPAPTIMLSESNFGPLPMPNGLTRLETRFLGEPGSVAGARDHIGRELDAALAAELGLVTFTPDDIDWEDEIRMLLEERASFSPDALVGMEANLRFAGPETLETKIFGRLTAWQNWIFQRPNAVSDAGALRRYGTGLRPEYDKNRV
jgi:benzoyl-CoA-dihydrodiol lyase